MKIENFAVADSLTSLRAKASAVKKEARLQEKLLRLRCFLKDRQQLDSERLLHSTLSRESPLPRGRWR